MHTLDAQLAFRPEPMDFGSALPSAAVPAHAVQFYDTDDFVAEQAADFVADGLVRGQAALVFATRRHLDDCARELTKRTIDVQRAVATSRLTLFDAGDFITRFAPEPGTFDVDRCRAALRDALARSSAAVNGGRVRVFGEMVDRLWRAGNASGAVRLEELWRELAAPFDFALLCAYQMDGFDDAAHSAAFERICHLHDHVRPTERAAMAPELANRVDAAAFEQRTRALAAELSRRERLHVELRELRMAAERARAEVDQANLAKSQFLSVMSHELRTPLNAIGGFAALLEMGVHGDVNDDQRDALARIQRSQRHLLSLINQVLMYAKLETRSVRYEIAGVPLASVFGMVDAMVLPQIGARGIRYVPASCGMLAVQADRDKLEQILLNLLSNAGKFTDTGGTVCVECAADDFTVYVHVRDTGIGIAAEKLSLIFEPFVQLETNYTRTRDGIGLGLATSREMARAMNGDLTVVSVVGEGSTFTLALPRAGR